jgi:hypothetical protein
MIVSEEAAPCGGTATIVGLAVAPAPAGTTTGMIAGISVGYVGSLCGSERRCSSGKSGRVPLGDVFFWLEAVFLTQERNVPIRLTFSFASSAFTPEAVR